MLQSGWPACGLSTGLPHACWLHNASEVLAPHPASPGGCPGTAGAAAARSLLSCPCAHIAARTAQSAVACMAVGLTVIASFCTGWCDCVMDSWFCLLYFDRMPMTAGAAAAHLLPLHPCVRIAAQTAPSAVACMTQHISCCQARAHSKPAPDPLSLLWLMVTSSEMIMEDPWLRASTVLQGWLF